MRKSVENISLLQKQINDLQLENQILKNILERSGISYTHEISRISEPENTEEYEKDQGARIIHPGQITDEMANLFYGFRSLGCRELCLLTHLTGFIP